MISVLHASIALLQHDGLTVYGKSNLEHLEGKLKADTGYMLTLEVERL
jgi:hypothetical protein